MTLRPREVEDDFVREQNRLRLNPTSFIGDLQDLVDNRDPYSFKTKIALEALDGKNLDDAVYDTIMYLRNVDSTHSLKHSRNLEKAAKEYFMLENPEERLAERVEYFCDWEGQLNEIVHYTRRGVNGRDILINILISDEDDTNKDIIFSHDFKYFGAKVGQNYDDEYCVVLTYASFLGKDIELDRRPYEGEIEYKFDELHDPAFSEYDVRKMNRKNSRRRVKYEEADNSIKPVHKPRSNYYLEETPGNHDIATFDDRSYITNELSRGTMDILTKDPLDKPMYDYRYSKYGGRNTHSCKDPRNFEEDRSVEQTFTVSDEYKTPGHYRNNLGYGRGSRKISQVTKSVDRRYGRAGTVVQKEVDKGYEDDLKQTLVPSRFTSRGGFTAQKSKYINDGNDMYADYVKKDPFELNDRVKKTYTVTKDDYFEEPDYYNSRYVRKSGFGKTAAMRDYASKIDYDRPLTSTGRYYEERNTYTKPNFDAAKHYKRRSTVFKSNLRTPKSRKSTFADDFHSKGSLTSRNTRGYSNAGRLTYLNRDNVTSKEYDLFDRF
ncbi:unnamed protein product [Moneuplotes crassus]|uniref:Uncharacterized protein n=1 Tax=Euplotes crassus TaxID=5936 RepID=A0AAD1U8G8_EUPCR|nr:unnamed protein product [Moneuplotes crassus]